MSEGVRYLSKKRTQCHRCNAAVVVLKVGTIAKHWVGPRGHKTVCAGSFSLPRNAVVLA